jgi:hypothetical protein
MPYLSECCSAPIRGEVIGEGDERIGLCSKCGEYMGVFDPYEEKQDDED